MTSLQWEIAGKEQKIQQLKDDVEKMKKESREKDHQLAVVSAKVNILMRGLGNLPSHVRVKVGNQAEKARFSVLRGVAAVSVALCWKPRVPAGCERNFSAGMCRHRGCGRVSVPGDAHGAVSPPPAKFPLLVLHSGAVRPGFLMAQ